VSSEIMPSYTTAQRRPADEGEGALCAELVSWLITELPDEWSTGVRLGQPVDPQLTAALDVDLFLRRLGATGFATPELPREYGGKDATPDEVRSIASTLNHFMVPSPNDFVGVNLVAPTLLAWGTDAQKHRYLPAIASCTDRWCQLFSEPGAGSDLASLTTRAVRFGDGWSVSGQKVWTSRAHRADHAILLARTEPDLPKRQGITFFVVDMHDPGVEVRPLRQMTGESHFSEVFLQDVQVSDDARVGPRGAGWKVAFSTLMSERTSLSVMQDDHHLAIDDLIRRSAANGWSNPALRDRTIQLLVRDRVLQLTNLRAQARLRVGAPPGPEGSITKLFSSELSRDIAAAAVYGLGSRASAWTPADDDAAHAVDAFLFGPARTIAGGTSEIQRNIIGERVLGLPREPEVDREVPWREIQTRRSPRTTVSDDTQ
jgi:alkylation response protein AidB-like acyl-CoA dehydrogenase